MGRRQAVLTADPPENIRVGMGDQGLVAVKLLGRQFVEVAVGEAAQHEIEFAGPTMPAPKSQSLASILVGLAHVFPHMTVPRGCSSL